MLINARGMLGLLALALSPAVLPAQDQDDNEEDGQPQPPGFHSSVTPFAVILN